MLGIYARAKLRHAEIRSEAYAAAREDAIADGLCGPALRLADIDDRALEVWRATWTGAHPSGAGGWSWAGLVEQRPRRAATLPVAIWYGTDLCGLALGCVSRRRLTGARHTISLTHVERRPEPPPVRLRGLIVPLVVAVAENYGRALLASRLRLRNPDPGLLRYYRDVLGFTVAWKDCRAVYCERRI